MMLSYSEECLELSKCGQTLSPSFQNQLAFWGFETNGATELYRLRTTDPASITIKLSRYCSNYGYDLILSKKLKTESEEKLIQAQLFNEAKANGAKFKDGVLYNDETQEFLNFLQVSVKRTLREHQVKAALHLLSVGNGANFSVPGSGKTTVILSVFEWLKKKGEVDALFVVGPPSCFWPWRNEFAQVTGKQPFFEILSGISADQRKEKYYTTKGEECDLYLTTFQTLANDKEDISTFFKVQGIRFYIVFDEAHYLKQVGGKWAKAALTVAQNAKRKCVLTGTPFPRSYTDAFNLFELLWPTTSPITEKDKHLIESYCQKRRYIEASVILRQSIDPLFYRVRKSDLNLAEQVFHPPIQVKMNTYEAQILDYILDRIHRLSESDYCLNYDISLHLRRGRMMRLRQCLSNCNLLKGAIDSYKETIITEKSSLYRIIKNYESLEKPGKLEKLINLVEEILLENKKVLIWSNFIGTLELIMDSLNEKSIGTKMIYGGTPTENANVKTEGTREAIISDFLDLQSTTAVLVANPGACAESISLHKSCSHAIYYDLSYNCAQYLQSLDRIHRVGGSENKPSHYYFLQYSSTLDEDILQNISDKAQRMEEIIGKEYPIYSLNMFTDDDEIEAYERIFGGE